MKTPTTRRLLEQLTTLGLTTAEIAAAVQACEMSVRRWRAGVASPHPHFRRALQDLARNRGLLAAQ